ncbi:MAG: hypothetical protein IRZ07_26955, partial [Microbispora sp.]|nr:hypothetical protein [Microbispora sp.]
MKDLVGRLSALDPDAGADVPGGAVLWLEREPPPGPVAAMVLERAAGAAQGVLDRTRGRAPARPPREDPALVEV